MSAPKKDPEQPGSMALFRTTRWSVVLNAGKRGSSDARESLEELCQVYWYPLYAFARRSGQNADDAMDTTQSFFAYLLENSWISRADPNRGRFRSYMLTIFRRFMSDQRRRAAAIKRGGNRMSLSIDSATAEQRYLCEPLDLDSPEDGFERQWALALLDRVLVVLRDEYRDRGRSDYFDELRQYLTGQETTPYADTAARLATTVNSVKVAVHRLRQRYRQILTNEIAQTVSSEEEVEDELRLLLQAFSR